MVYTIAIVLMVLWVLGMIAAYTMSGLIHLLLVIALVLVIFRLISGKKRI